MTVLHFFADSKHSQDLRYVQKHCVLDKSPTGAGSTSKAEDEVGIWFGLTPILCYKSFRLEGLWVGIDIWISGKVPSGGIWSV